MIKEVIKKALEKLDLKVDKVTKIHLDELGSPIDAIYYNGKFGQRQLFSFDVPIEKCINIYGYKFSESESHQFVKTIKEFETNRNLSYKNSVLYNFYKNFQPRNLKEVYFLHSQYKKNLSKNSNSPLLEKEPKILMQPWFSDIIEPFSNGKEIKEEGLSYLQGSQSFGPVTTTKGELEFSRIINTYNSIKTKGYHVDFFHNQISGYFLKNENDYRFVIQNGNHRVASLSALGYKKIPVIFRFNYPRYIDIRDINLWPQVKNGNISLEDAKIIFNIMFTGRDFSNVYKKY